MAKKMDGREPVEKKPKSFLGRLALYVLIAGVLVTAVGIGGGYFAQRMADPLRREGMMAFFTSVVRFGSMALTGGAAVLFFLWLWRIRPGQGK